MKALKVRKEIAEEVRKRVERLGLKDRSRRIRFENGYVIIPVVDGFDLEIEGAEVVEDANPVFRERKNFREIVESIAGHYPRYADLKLFGRVGVMKLPGELIEYRDRIAEEVVRHYGLKALWLDRGRHGMLRKPEMEPLFGDESMVEHRENGCIFRFDLTKVMYSQGNQYEKMRVARLVGDGEVVLDMFAGIGYFTIPVAKHSRAKRVYAVEINPDSYFFLLENVRLNGVRNVVPILGDSMHVIPESFADRVIMGHIYAEQFLQNAISALRDEGWVHYHEAVPVRVMERPVERVRRAAERMGARVVEIGMRKVKNYAPNVLHVVVDARIKRLSE
ncbi:MAG: class I SAM-dependent methyltransferase family protein [Archaeoglobi archaeon]|nr:class I SAM-dependent methyltransferase family protein [Archaeoglobi archaeon]